MSSIYKVEREVDTVIIEMDISVAEQLSEILFLVQDNTRMAQSYIGSALNDLRVRMVEDAKVRTPSSMYRAEPRDGYVLLRNTTPAELDASRRARGLR